MELTIRDRVVIINTVLPQFDTRKNIELKQSIVKKIELSEAEQNDVVLIPAGRESTSVGFKTEEAIIAVEKFEFTGEELQYLKHKIDVLDQNGMFSVETLETYNKILDFILVSDAC